MKPGRSTSPPSLARVLVARHPGQALAWSEDDFLNDHRACVIGVTAEAEMALGLAQELHPDVALVSSRLVTNSGDPLLLALQRVSPEVRVVAMVPTLGLAAVSEALRNGAASVVEEGSAADVICEAIRAAASGRSLLTGATASVLLKGLEPRRRVGLTPRQLQVLDLLDRKLNNAEIALRLGIRPATVRLHIRHILQRLGASSPMQAISLARRKGLVHPD